MTAADKRRLQWRCRRGMLELDLLLDSFIEQHFQQLDEGQMAALDNLLALPDKDLWNLLMMQSSVEVKNSENKQLLLVLLQAKPACSSKTSPIQV